MYSSSALNPLEPDRVGLVVVRFDRSIKIEELIDWMKFEDSNMGIEIKPQAKYSTYDFTPQYIYVVKR